VKAVSFRENRMASDTFNQYIREINRAYLREDATEHTHRPAMKAFVEGLSAKVMATNEPKRTACGAPDFIISRGKKRLDQTIGYIECKDIGTSLKEAAKTEQIKKRYLPSFHNFILTDYIEFWWYVDGEKRLTARLAEEKKEGFKVTEQGRNDVAELFECFFAQEPEKVTTAKDLAIRMAHKARMMRDVITKTFEQEVETGTLHGQYEGFKEVLLHDLTEIEFADMYAQTISYGLFTARCHIDEVTLYGKDKHAVFHGMNGKPGEFTREHAAFMLPKTNPFLRSVFGHIAGPDLDDRVAWLVDDLVELLRQADMGEVLRDFAKKKGRRDPVVHFYETFLGQYDPKMKKKRGVYYTPDEVVSYIVRSVDWLLKEKFGLKRGLADESKVKIKDENGKVKETHKVLVLDPAVGTGTFLFEVIDQIYTKFKRQKGAWSAYVREHLLPRLFGFEIQMAPYAVCHMKLGLQLAEKGYDFASDERLGIYLTNTLEEAEEISKNVFVQELSKEARGANKVKKDLPIMVVLGNPPYAAMPANKGSWITDLVRRSYYPDDEIREQNPKLLLDDYVKFVRFGQWRIERTGQGILALITNHGYLDNPTFRKMRKELMRVFSEIYVLDLHGNANRKEVCPNGSKDENVFDIRQGVSVGIFVRIQETGGCVRMYHADLWGKRKEKCDWLDTNSVGGMDWNVVRPTQPFILFKKQDDRSLSAYEEGWRICDIMVVSSMGIKTNRDRLLLDFTKKTLVERISELAEKSVGDEEIMRKYDLKDSPYWNTNRERGKIRSVDWVANIFQCEYRPFDKRWILYQQNLIEIGRGGAATKVMFHLINHENFGLIFMRQVAIDEAYSHVGISRNLVDNRTFYSNKGATSIAPLYIYQLDQNIALFEEAEWDTGKDGRIPNLSREFVEEMAKKIGLDFVSDGRGNLKGTFGPEDVFDYIYGILYSPEYRRRYAEFLKIDFPRIPWPKDRETFEKVASVGRELVGLHLMEHPILEDENRWPRFPAEGDNEVEKGYPKYVAKADEPGKERVYINKEQYFEGVRPEVWESHIGGYQVCEKWLKDRKGRELSYDDIRHYQKVIVALSETIRLMEEKCLSEMFA